MENKINIAEILRDMPKGTKLYSPLFGEVKFKEVVFGNIFPIKVLPKAPDSPTVSFTENGFFTTTLKTQKHCFSLLVKCETGLSSSSVATW